jgi:hypothetical protein
VAPYPVEENSDAEEIGGGEPSQDQVLPYPPFGNRIKKNSVKPLMPISNRLQQAPMNLKKKKNANNVYGIDLRGSSSKN